MKTKTLNDLGQRIESLSPERRTLLKQWQGEKAITVNGLAIRRRAAADPRLLSFNQQRLWFLDQLMPRTATYNVPFFCRIRGVLQVPAWHRAVQAIVNRHEVLRTVFSAIKGKPVPVVPKNWSLEQRDIDLRSCPESTREMEALRLLRQQAARPFNLSRDGMLRTTLVRLAEEEYLFLHVSHHIAWDLKSKELFYQEVVQHYEAFSAGRLVTLPELSIQYADYALWQRRWLQGEMLERLVSYWKRQLAGAPSKLELPIDHPRPSVQSLRGAKVPVRLPKALLDAVKSLSLGSGVTSFMTLLAAFKIFLFCYTGQEDLCVGSPVLGRQQVEVETLIGFFINTVVLRTRVSPNLSLRELMGRTREVTLGAIAHQALPFDKLVEALRPPRDLSRMPLFQVNFRVQGPPMKPQAVCGLVISAPDYIDSGTSRFDLALELPSTEDSHGFWEYSTDLFADSTVSRMADDFERLLGALISHPDTRLDAIAVVQEIRERQRNVRLG
jgi:hypothetical protein